MSFKQKRFGRSYIKLNTNKRRKATNPFDIAIAKLTNNSFFGKTIEDESNYVHYQFVNSARMYDRLSNEPNFNHGEIYHENWVLVEMKKVTTCLSKPRYVLNRYVLL